MLQQGNRKLCSNCFADLKQGENACPQCGYADGGVNAARNPIALPMGSVLLGRYVIGKVLGKGGFGVTYLAYDLKADRTVAIKEYLPDALIHRNTGDTIVSTYQGEKEEAFRTGAEKFYEEAKTIARFGDSPNIVRVFEFFYENNTAYFVMEYLSGHDLKTYIAEKGGKLTEAETLDIIAPLLDALGLVHEAGVLHRDISPDNIYITENGGVKLLDFGSARQVLGEQSKSLSVVLKPGFAPIEQYQTRGRQGEWTDIYALAATAYYCLTGKVPEAAMDRIEEDRLLLPSELGSDITPEFERILKKALSVRAVDRYQTTGELKAAISAVRPGLFENAGIPPISTSADSVPAAPCKLAVKRNKPKALFTRILSGLGSKRIALVLGAVGIAVIGIAAIGSSLAFSNKKAVPSEKDLKDGTRVTGQTFRTREDTSFVSDIETSAESETEPPVIDTSAAPSNTAQATTAHNTAKPSQTTAPAAAPPLSSNCSLSSLTLSDSNGQTLYFNPGFSANTTQYYITVDYTSDKVAINAQASDSQARLTKEGAPQSGGYFRLASGENTLRVTVTAPSGAAKVYEIYIFVTPNVYDLTPYNDRRVERLNFVETHLEYAGSELKMTVRIYNNHTSNYSGNIDITPKVSNIYTGVKIAEKSKSSHYVSIPCDGGYTDLVITFSGGEVLSANANLSKASFSGTEYTYAWANFVS